MASKLNVKSLILISLGVFIFCSGQSQTGLLVHYPLNGNAIEPNNRCNNGSVNGALPTTDQNMHPNSALEFDGVDDYVEISDCLNIHLDSQFTISTCVYPKGFYTGPCQANYILGKGSDNEVGHYSLTYQDDDGECATVGQYWFFGFAVNFSGKRLAVNISAIADTIKLNKWYHIVGVYDGVKLKLYIDGVLKGLSQDSHSDTLTNNSKNLLLGRMSNPNFPYYLNGKIDEVKIFNRPLSDVEIQNLKTTSMQNVNQKMENSFQLFPNPVKDVVKLDGDYKHLVKYVIYQQYGSQIVSGLLNNNEINVEKLSPGIYYIRIFDDRKKSGFSTTFLKL